MSAEARLLGAAFIVAFLVILIRMVRHGRLRAKYSFLWLLSGAAIIALVVVPGLLESLADTAGIFYPPTLLFVAATMLLMFVSLHFSWELSRLEERTRTLAEEVAILGRDVRELRAAAARAEAEVDRPPVEAGS